MTEREIFTAARNIADVAVCATFLDAACAGDASLRERVESLLAEHEQLGSFLDSPSPTPALDQPASEVPGTQIGPYKLLQQIGEGGFGVVYMAEQTEPVQRKVALKVIKPGMDSRHVIARFELERQALAMMDHVNIARVFDAGATESGRPYFVMELVHGVPITKYCDDNHLTPRERLELFVPVCQAIQHAHQKGIIHRDIKPSNVMVTLYDGLPVPKVIDFGVAKATEQKLTERTLFTQYGTMVGTLEYMSPEQAEMSALGVDTRSDIYSLGVLLYELLTGSTPLTHKRMKEAAYAEILRMIKEEEPPTPSTRLSESGEALASISAKRHTEPTKLTKLVRGELDWIVMKCLEKDRNRRYETASGFAADVQRYLNDEMVQACPPSAGYRLRKFVRRNKAAVAVAAMALFFLVLLGGGTGWTVRDREARRAKLAGQLELILDEVKQLQVEQKWSEALVAARRAEALLAAGGTADAVLQQQVQQALADLKLVQRLEEIRLEQTGRADPFARFRWAERAYADAFRDAGVDFDRLTEEAIVQQLRARPQVAQALAGSLYEWSTWRALSENPRGARALATVAKQIDADPWRLQVRRAFEQIEDHGGAPRQFVIDVTRLAPEALEGVKTLEVLAASPDLTRQPPMTLYLVGMALSQGLRKPEIGVSLLRKAQLQYPGDFWINFGLGWTLKRLGPPHQDEALAFFRAAVALRPNAAWVWMHTGEIYQYHCKRLDEANACYTKALKIDPNSASIHTNVGQNLLAQNKPNEAIASFRKAIELDPKLALPHANLAWHLATAPDPKLRDLQAAVDHARQAVDLAPDTPNHWSRLGVALLRAGDAKAAVVKLENANQMLNGGDHRHRFFLAMAYWQCGEKDKARQTYENGVQWMDKNQPENEELRRFRTEAEELMKQESENRSQQTKSNQPIPGGRLLTTDS